MKALVTTTSRRSTLTRLSMCLWCCRSRSRWRSRRRGIEDRKAGAAGAFERIPHIFHVNAVLTPGNLDFYVALVSGSYLWYVALEVQCDSPRRLFEIISHIYHAARCSHMEIWTSFHWRVRLKGGEVVAVGSWRFFEAIRVIFWTPSTRTSSPFFGPRRHTVFTVRRRGALYISVRTDCMSFGRGHTRRCSARVETHHHHNNHNNHNNKKKKKKKKKNHHKNPTTTQQQHSADQGP